MVWKNYTKDKSFKNKLLGKNEYYHIGEHNSAKVLTDEAKDINKLPTKGVEGVILLAALLPANSSVDLDKDENAADYFKINTIGTINILEYCRKNNIKKFISCSSYADVFNAWKKGYAIKETEPRNYNYKGDHAVYVFSKNAAEDMIHYYNEQHGLQGAMFRFPPVYGVGPHGSIYVNGKVYKSGIQTFIEKAEKGENIEIWGNFGSQSWKYTKSSWNC